MRKIIFFIIKILFIFIAPFILLIRGANYVHRFYEWNAWLALLAGMFFTAVLLLIYLVFIQGKLTGRLGTMNSLKNKFILTLILVVGYSIHGLLFLSADNIKNQSIKKEYQSLHPILRISLSTLIHLDEELILTDAKRQPEDYRKMGLKTNRNSLHYKQPSGFVHAVDIRTNNRSEFRNWIVECYFKLMGFNTLRHTGTADHLHISITSLDRLGAI